MRREGRIDRQETQRSAIRASGFERLFTRFERITVEQADFRRESRCAMMQIHGSAVLEWSSGRIFRAKPRRFFEKNDETGARFPKIDNGDDVAAFDLPRAIANKDIR